MSFTMAAYLFVCNEGCGLRAFPEAREGAVDSVIRFNVCSMKLAVLVRAEGGSAVWADRFMRERGQ